MANPNPNPNPQPNKGGLDLSLTTGKNTAKPTTVKGGLDLTQVNKPNPATKFAEYSDTRFKSFVNPDEYVDYIPNGAVMDNEALDRTRAKNQGYTAQFVGAVGQSLVGEILGGTLEGFGSLGDFLYSKVTGEDTDFNNALISMGKGLKEITKENLPIYMENPNESFQLGKWDYWMNMAPSIASSISMLIPSTGVVKGLSYLGKFAKLAKYTDNLSDAYKYAATVATGSLVSRNAENYISSHEVFNDTFKEASKSLEVMPDSEYEKLLNSEVGQEFLKEKPNGSKTEFASYIASRAGWRNYNNNMTNLIFDVIQYASWFRALGASTRSASYLDDAVRASMGAKQTLLNKVKSKTLGFLSPIGGQLTEGIEEGINFIGQAEAMRYGKSLYGALNPNDKSKFSDRLSEYLKDDKMQESMFFGVLGGVAFESAANLANKKYDKEMIGNKLAEANSRKAYIENFNTNLTTLEKAFKDNKISEEEYVANVEDLKKDLGYELGYSASKVGNVNLLLENLDNEEFRSEVAKSLGIDVNSSALGENLAGLKADILKAEKNYKDATKFLALNSNVNEKAKFLFLQNYLNISKQMSKQEEALTNINNNIVELSNTVLDTSDPETYDISQKLIKAHALKIASEYMTNMDRKGLASHLIASIDDFTKKYKNESDSLMEELKSRNTNIKGLDSLIELTAEKYIREAAFKGDKKELATLLDRKSLQEAGAKIDAIEEQIKNKTDEEHIKDFEEMVKNPFYKKEEVLAMLEDKSETVKTAVNKMITAKEEEAKKTEKAQEADAKQTIVDDFKPTENFNPEKFKLNNFKIKPDEFTFNMNKIKEEEEIEDKLTRIAKMIKIAERTKDYMLVEYLKNLRHFITNGGTFGKKAESSSNESTSTSSESNVETNTTDINDNKEQQSNTPNLDPNNPLLTADKVDSSTQPKTDEAGTNTTTTTADETTTKPARYVGHWILEAEITELKKLVTKAETKEELAFYIKKWNQMDLEDAVKGMKKFARALNRAKFAKASTLLEKIAEEVEKEKNNNYNVEVVNPISEVEVSNQAITITPETVINVEPQVSVENSPELKNTNTTPIIEDSTKPTIVEEPTSSPEKSDNPTTLKETDSPIQVLNENDLINVPTVYDFYAEKNATSELPIQEKETVKETPVKKKRTRSNKKANKVEEEVKPTEVISTTDTATEEDKPTNTETSNIIEPTTEIIVTDNPKLDYLNETVDNIVVNEPVNTPLEIKEEEKVELETPLIQEVISENEKTTNTNQDENKEEVTTQLNQEPKAEEINESNIEELKGTDKPIVENQNLVENTTNENDGNSEVISQSADKKSVTVVETPEINLDDVESVMDNVTQNTYKVEETSPVSTSTPNDTVIGPNVMYKFEETDDEDTTTTDKVRDDLPEELDPNIDNKVVSSAKIINENNKIQVGTNIFVDSLVPNDSNFTYVEDNLVASEDAEKVLEALNSLDKDELKMVTVKIAFDSLYYKENMGYTHVPLGIYYKGVRIGYVNVANSITKEIEAWEKSNKPEKEKQIVLAMLNKNLQEVRKLREFFKNSDNTLNSTAEIMTKIIRLTDGQIVQNVNDKGEVVYKELKDNLVGEQGKDYEFAIVTPEDSALGRKNMVTVLNGKNNKHATNAIPDSFNNSDRAYSDGGMYVLVNGFRSKSQQGFEVTQKEDGSYDNISLVNKIPVRVFSSNIQEADAVTLYGAIMEIMQILDNPALDFNKNQRLNKLRELISSITAYNSFNENQDGTVNKPNFKIHKDRIEFLFDNDTKLMSIYVNNGKTSLIIHNIKKGALKNKFDSAEDYKEAIGEPINLYKDKAAVMYWKDSKYFDKVLMKALKTKRYNVNFKKLLNGEEDFNRDYVQTGKIISDLGCVRNREGKPVSNFVAKKISRFGQKVTPARQSSTSDVKTNNLEITLSNNYHVKDTKVYESKPYKIYNEEDTIINDYEENHAVTNPDTVVVIETNQDSKEKVTKPRKPKIVKESWEEVEKSKAKMEKKKEKTTEPKKTTESKKSSKSKKEEEVKPTTEPTKTIEQETNVSPVNEQKTSNKTEPVVKKDSLLGNLKNLKVNSETNNSLANTKNGDDLSDNQITDSNLNKVIKSENDEDIDISKTLSKFKGLGLKPTRKSIDDLKKDLNVDKDDDSSRTMAIHAVAGSKEPSTPETKKSNFERLFGKNIEYDGNVESLIYHKGTWAYGLFSNSAVRIYKNAPEGTEYHEAFHVVMHLYLNENDRTRVLNQMKELYPNIKDEVELEEILAEDFRAYALLKDSGLSTKLFDKKYGSKNSIKSFLESLYNFIANLLGINTYKATNIKDLFSNIYSGNFNYKPDNKTIAYAKKIGYMMEAENIDMNLESYFTPKDIQTYTSSLGLFVMEYINKYQDSTNRDILESEDRMSVKKYVLNKLVSYLDVAYTAYENAVEAGTMSEEEIAPLKDKAEALHTIITLFGNRKEGFWKETLFYVEKNLNMKVSKDLESAVETIDTEVNDEALLKKDWDDTKAFSVSSKESFDSELRRIIMTTPNIQSVQKVKNEDGTYELVPKYRFANAAGLPVPLNYNTVYPYIMNQMATATTMEEMLSRLENIAYNEPSIFLILEQIKNDPILKAKWFSNFNKAFLVEEHHRINTESGIVVSDVSNKQYSISNDWSGNINMLIDLLRQDGNEILFDEVKTKITNNLQLLTSMITNPNTKLDEELVNLIVEITKELNIPFTKEMVNNILTNPLFTGNQPLINSVDSIFLKPLTFVSKSIILSVESKKTNRRVDFNQVGTLNNLAKLYSYYNFNGIESTYVNPMGNTVYSFTKHNFMTDFFTVIESYLDNMTVNKKLAEDNLLSMLKEFAADPSMRYSNWLFSDDGNGFLNGNPKNLSSLTLNKKALENFKFRKLGGLKNMISGIGAGYSALTDEDYDLHNILTYSANVTENTATYPIQIQSDSGNLYSVKAKRIPVEVNAKGEILVGKGSKIFEGFSNIFRQEMVRMKAAYELLFEFEEYTLSNGSKSTRLKLDANGGLIPKKLTEEVLNQLEKNYHYKSVDSDGKPIFVKNGKPTGNVFKFTSLVGSTVDINALLEKDGVYKDGILRTDLFTASTNEIIENAISELIKEEIASGMADYKKYEDKFIPKKVDEKWNTTFRDTKNNNLLGSYDTFEHFVADYVLNTYLANVEMFNFFTGYVSEFKNATDSNKRAKQTTSPKLVGATLFRGVTYKAAVVNDIEIVSSNITEIANNLASNMRIHNPLLTADKFNESNLQLKASGKDVTLTNLEAAVYTIIENYYKGTSIADAQGYLTLDRYEKICKDYGRWNRTYEILFRKAKAGEELSSTELKTLLQVLKPFYYHRRYNPITKRVESRQIKTSLMPLIPSLIKGTQLEKINEAMLEKDIEELYFESASKVGTKRISAISNDSGLLRDDFKNNLIGEEFFNSHWGLQLDVPEHGKDEVNKLGVQIVKIIFSNLSEDSIYVIPGSDGSTYTGSELRDLFHSALSKNIEEDSETLLERLGITKDENGKLSYKDITKIQQVLLEELKANDMNKNYLDAVQLGLNSSNEIDFILPLSVGNMTKKFQSLLTSLFTNKVINQKMPGGHYTLASEAFISLIEKAKTEEEISKMGINLTEKAKENLKKGKRLLDYHVYSNENTIVTTALLPAWSTKFFKEGQRIDINELPEDIRTMIGYRIPTEGKYSTVVFEVVGFLPESAGSTVVVPYELVTQTGWDFDVDSLYVMQKELNQSEDGVLNAPSMFEGDYSRKSRNNLIIDIFKAVLQNTYHYKEVISPGKFNDAVNMKKRQEKLLGLDKQNINPFSHKGQKGFRKANIAGRKLKGMAANINSLLPILQNVKASTDRPIKMAYEINTFAEYQNAVNKHGDKVSSLDKEYNERNKPKNPDGTEMKDNNKNLKNVNGTEYVHFDLTAYKNETETYQSIIPSKLIFKNTGVYKVGDIITMPDDITGIYQVTSVSKLRKNFSIKNTSEATNIIEEELAVIRQSEANYELITVEKVDEYATIKATEDNFPKKIQIEHANFGFNVDGSYTNLNGDIITDHAAQMLAMVLDIVKEGFPHNVNSYTFNTYMAMLGLGIDIMHAGIYIRQPILFKLAEMVQNNESIFTADNVKPVEAVRNSYEMSLLAIRRHQKSKEAMDYIKENEYFINTNKKLPASKDKNGIDLKALALGITPSKEKDSFTLQELESMLALSADKKRFSNLSKKTNQELEELADFYINQLMVLDTFLVNYKTGTEFGNLPQVINMDKMGVGPSLSVTEIWETRYNNVANNIDFSITTKRKETIENKEVEVTMPVTTAIYERDAYTVFKSYREFGNKAAVEALTPLFLELSPAFKAIRRVFYTQFRVPMNEKNDTLINNYLLAYLNNGLFDFANNKDITARVLGEKNNKLKQTYTIEEFKMLSAAEQLYYFKTTNPETYLNNPEHILNFLSPKIDTKSLERNQYQKIEVTKPSPSDNIDYEVSQTFLAMLYSENEFEKELAESLFKYNYLISYLNFTKDSFSNLIPTSELISRGLGEHLQMSKKYLNTHNSLLFVNYTPSWLNNEMENNLTKKLKLSAEEKYSDISLSDETHLTHLSHLFRPLFYNFLQNHSNNSNLVPKISKNLFSFKPLSDNLGHSWEPMIISSKDSYKLAPKIRNKNAYLVQSTNEKGETVGTLYVKIGTKSIEVSEGEYERQTVYIPMERRGGKSIKYEFSDSIFNENKVVFPKEAYASVYSYLESRDQDKNYFNKFLLDSLYDISSTKQLSKDSGAIDCQ